MCGSGIDCTDILWISWGFLKWKFFDWLYSYEVWEWPNTIEVGSLIWWHLANRGSDCTCIMRDHIVSSWVDETFLVRVRHLYQQEEIHNRISAGRVQSTGIKWNLLTQMIYIYQKTRELQPKTITAHPVFYFFISFFLNPNYVFPDVDFDMQCGLHG